MSTPDTDTHLAPTDIDYRDGHFYWADLMSPDIAAAEPFYADLLRWIERSSWLQHHSCHRTT